LFGEPVGLHVFFGGVITLVGVFYVIKYGD
jgi:hypothetical protein